MRQKYFSRRPCSSHYRNVVHGLGLGLFAWADVVIAGLDNVKRGCGSIALLEDEQAWIDGAIEGINGVARALRLDSLLAMMHVGETDWAILNKRMSCNLLALESDTEGKVATTANHLLHNRRGCRCRKQ